MYLGTFLDVEGNWIDTTHFPNAAPENRFSGMGCYLIEGKVVDDFGVPSIEVRRFERLPFRMEPRLES